MGAEADKENTDRNPEQIHAAVLAIDLGLKIRLGSSFFDSLLSSLLHAKYIGQIPGYLLYGFCKTMLD